VPSDRRQVPRLLAWAETLDAERLWAVESANGLGRLLSQQLVAAGEQVVDVPATGLRHDELRPVVVEDHTAVLRLLSDRHRDLGSLRTQTICRLHVLVRELIPGGAPLRLQADRATVLLRRVRPASPVEVERKRLAQDLLGDIRRLDRDLEDLKGRITSAVAASGTRLTELHGVGTIVAAIVLGQVGDPRRFPSRDRFASYNGTAPIEASSGPRVRHRLNQRGNGG
jgi:transposase